MSTRIICLILALTLSAPRLASSAVTLLNLAFQLSFNDPGQDEGSPPQTAQGDRVLGNDHRAATSPPVISVFGMRTCAVRVCWC